MGTRAAWGVVILAALAAVCPGQTARVPLLEEANRVRQSGDLDRAVHLYESIVRAEPQNAEAWFFLGYSLHERGEYDRAIFVYRRSAEFPRYRALAYYNIGCAQALSGRTDEAFASLRQAINAGYASRRQFESDADLRSLRGDPRWMQLFGIDEAGINHALDFWLGEWQVLSSTGRLLGSATVQRRPNAFAIHETLQVGSGVGADGFIYYDPDRKAWRYTRVDGRGGVLRLEGEYSEDAIRFNGSRVTPDGARTTARARLAPGPRGDVQLLIEHSYDNGSNWEAVTDLRFVGRRFAADPTSEPASSQPASSQAAASAPANQDGTARVRPGGLPSSP